VTSLQFSLVISVEAAPEISAILFLSLATFIAARAVDVVTMSVITSTLSRSNHSRALLEAMSPLFWWSAATTSMANAGLSLALKSSTAIFTASTAPAPARSE
jgi:hypothetical protein